MSIDKSYTIKGINAEGHTEHRLEAGDNVDAVLMAKDLVGVMMDDWDKFTIEVEVQE